MSLDAMDVCLGFLSSGHLVDGDAMCRDVKNQVYSAKMNSRLKDFDPSSQATRMQGISLAPQAYTGSVLNQGAQSQAAGPMPSDDRMAASLPAEEQREMDQLRQQRMQAMLRRRKNAIAAADAGFGTLRDVSASAAQVCFRTSSWHCTPGTSCATTVLQGRRVADMDRIE